MLCINSRIKFCELQHHMVALVASIMFFFIFHFEIVFSASQLNWDQPVTYSPVVQDLPWQTGG